MKNLSLMLFTLISLNLFAQITCPDTAPYPSIKEITPETIDANYNCGIVTHRVNVKNYLLEQCKNCAGVPAGKSATFRAHYNLKKKQGQQIIHEEWESDSFVCKDSGSTKFCSKYMATKVCTAPNECQYVDGRCLDLAASPANCAPVVPTIGVGTLLKSEKAAALEENMQ